MRPLGPQPRRAFSLGDPQMQIVITKDELLARFGNALDVTSKRALLEMSRGLSSGGDKMRTQVRHALQKQTSVKKYGTVVAGTKAFMQTPLSYVIMADGKGLPIQEFKFQIAKNELMKERWSSTQHWKFQLPRDAKGHFGKLVDPTAGVAGVTATVWGTRHAFKRSFMGKTQPVMQRYAGKPSLRALYGPSLAKELTQGQSLQAFEASVHTVVMDAIAKRVAKLLPT